MLLHGYGFFHNPFKFLIKKLRSFFFGVFLPSKFQHLSCGVGLFWVRVEGGEGCVIIGVRRRLVRAQTKGCWAPGFHKDAQHDKGPFHRGPNMATLVVFQGLFQSVTSFLIINSHRNKHRQNPNNKLKNEAYK